MALPPSLPFAQLPAEGDAALEDASGTKKDGRCGSRPVVTHLIGEKNDYIMGYVEKVP